MNGGDCGYIHTNWLDQLIRLIRFESAFVRCACEYFRVILHTISWKSELNWLNVCVLYVPHSSRTAWTFSFANSAFSWHFLPHVFFIIFIIHSSDSIVVMKMRREMYLTKSFQHTIVGCCVMESINSKFIENGEEKNCFALKKAARTIAFIRENFFNFNLLCSPLMWIQSISIQYTQTSRYFHIPSQLNHSFCVNQALTAFDKNYTFYAWQRREQQQQWQLWWP